MPVPTDGLVGLADLEHLPPFGSMPNERHQSAKGFLTGAPYRLAFVEFDDQGSCHDRGQMDRVAAEMEALAARKEDVIVVAFVHGWKHDARTDDDNLCHFRDLLAKTAAFEQGSNPKPRPVLGVFVGWRGLSKYGPVDAVADTTFWEREAAGQRVSTGSVRELFGRLRAYRNARLKDEAATPLLVIAGHSFGGMIVYSALEQSLIEAAAASASEIVPSFADLVLLVNPAIQGTRYLPIQDLVSSTAFADRTAAQLPVFVCAQAENDEPVGTWFRVGHAADRFEQATRGPLEEECLTHALGFVTGFRTHSLSGPAPGCDFELSPPDIAKPNPFWVVGAAKEVIDGHGGIWQEPFLQFLASLLFQHVRASTGSRRVAPVPPRGTGAKSHLAVYARELEAARAVGDAAASVEATAGTTIGGSGT